MNLKRQDISVGDVFVSNSGEEITVTELTTRGFKYASEPRPFIPRWGMSFAGGGEIFLDEDHLMDFFNSYYTQLEPAYEI